jgi:Outer membrane receptor proteins, mostly Fe transport
MFEKGSRDRYNAVAGFEYRADEDFNLYIDFIFGHVRNTMNRSDIGWGVRGGNSATQMIPVGLAISPDWLNSVFTSGLGGAASSGTFYNATFGLEARDYTEQGDFLNLNPGMSWRVSERLSIDFEAYYTRSHFFRTNPTVMASSCVSTPPPAGIQNCPNGPPSLGTVLNFNAAGNYPSETINIDLNDPRNYEWYLGRVNLSGEKRYTNTKGAHLDFAYGSELFMLKTGVAYDEAYRLMTTIDDTATWQEKVCGDNPSVVLLPPNSQLPPCTGQVAAVPADWNRPAYPGYGSGYSAGAPPLAFRGSLIPAASLADYLIPGPTGFVTVDYAKFFAASDYNSILSRAVESVRCIPHCSLPGFPANTVLYPGFASAFDERNTGIYAKVAGGIVFHTRMLKYDVGLRWVETRQNVISPYLKTDPRNASLQDGGYYPNYYQLVPAKSAYHALLPSASFVYELDDAMQLRFSLSRSMNRPNPNAMSGVISFSDPNVTTATLGNSYLRPYFSNNIDIGAEYYLGREGYVGVAFFRKSISGFTAQITKTQNFSFLSQYGITWSSLGLQQQMNYQTSGGPSGVPCNSDASCADHPVAVNQQVNLPGLEIINGLEIDYVQPLDRLFAGIGLEGFGFSGNLTIIDQKSTGNVATYAIGVAPYQYNVTGFYERNGIMLRLSYNWNDGSYGSSTNNQNVCFPALPGGDRPAGCSGGSYLFNSPYGQLDMSSSLKLSRLFGSIPSDPALTFEVQNLLNAKQSTYGQMKSAVHSYYEKGQTLLVGVRGAL